MRETKTNSTVQEADVTLAKSLRYWNTLISSGATKTYFPWDGGWYRTYWKIYWINWLWPWFVTWKNVAHFLTCGFTTINVLHEKSFLKDKKPNYITINISSEDPKIHTFYCHVNLICWICSINSTFVQSSVWAFQS